MKPGTIVKRIDRWLQTVKQRFASVSARMTSKQIGHYFRLLEGSLFPHDATDLLASERIVSVDLAGESRPAVREISQNLSFGLILR